MIYEKDLIMDSAGAHKHSHDLGGLTNSVQAVFMERILHSLFRPEPASKGIWKTMESRKDVNVAHI